jgi:aminopeptidase N
METPPKTVRLDPHNRWLKTVKWQKPAEMWRHELRQAPEAVWRALAARELGKSADARAVADLRAALVEDPFWGVRAEAAKALGKIRGPAALEALEAGLGVEHPKARKAVASALGEFRGDEHASDLLLKLLADDASYFVEAEAARALGKTRTRRALDALLAALPRESFQQVLRARALEGLGELRDVRALPAVLERSRYGEAMQARVAAAKALGLLGEGNREVREHVERMLIEDPEFRVRREAADALWKLGDASGLGALDRAAAADIDGRVRRAARETALRLRDGKRPPEALRELRKDVDALRAENDRLRTRLDRIEGAK